MLRLGDQQGGCRGRSSRAGGDKDDLAVIVAKREWGAVTRSQQVLREAGATGSHRARSQDAHC